MIRYLRYVFLAVLAVVLMTVALANRDEVTLSAAARRSGHAAGLGLAVEVPLFLVIFASIAAGLLIGFVWEWLREYKHRRVASTKTREAARLERGRGSAPASAWRRRRRRRSAGRRLPAMKPEGGRAEEIAEIAQQRGAGHGAGAGLGVGKAAHQRKGGGRDDG
jgi:lipopolysaccharide assembly protein A